MSKSVFRLITIMIKFSYRLTVECQKEKKKLNLYLENRHGYAASARLARPLFL